MTRFAKPKIKARMPMRHDRFAGGPRQDSQTCQQCLRRCANTDDRRVRRSLGLSSSRCTDRALPSRAIDGPSIYKKQACPGPDSTTRGLADFTSLSSFSKSSFPLVQVAPVSVASPTFPVFATSRSFLLLKYKVCLKPIPDFIYSRFAFSLACPRAFSVAIHPWILGS